MSIAAEAVGRIALVGAGVATSYFDLTTPVLGAPLNIVAGACLGAIAGLAWSKQVLTRRQLIGLVISIVIISCSITATIPWLVNHYLKAKIAAKDLAPVAVIIAYFGCYWVPAVNERIGSWLDRIPFIGKRRD